MEALGAPRTVDLQMVDAQQARRVLDRLVGFELSPLVIRTFNQSGLSAGRVQSVVLRLIVEREGDIAKFESESYFQVCGIFSTNAGSGSGSGSTIKTQLNRKMSDEASTKQLLEDCVEAMFRVEDIKEGKRVIKPSPPFTTSTLQQIASSTLKISTKGVMKIAQSLYENGYITYHRTDSVHISEEAIIDISTFIREEYGERYLKVRKYQQLAKGAQEAHEAIRPTKIGRRAVGGDMSVIEGRVYTLIWKRTVASQMEAVRLDVVKVSISIGTPIGTPIGTKSKMFIGKGENITFDGFWILGGYSQSDDNQQYNILIQLKVGDVVNRKTITGTEKYSKGVGHFSESTLVKKMEKLGVGRPSTYASMISKIQDPSRGYVEKRSTEGRTVKGAVLQLSTGEIQRSEYDIKLNCEKNKLFSTDIGKSVNQFVLTHFGDSIINYQFTNEMESELDKIAKGESAYPDVVGYFYNAFHPKVVEVKSALPASGTGGTDGIPGLLRKIGEYKGIEVLLKKGKYGLYLQYDKSNVSLKGVSVSESKSIVIEDAIKRIQESQKRIIHRFDNGLKVMNGKFGPFIVWKGKCTSIPDGYDVTELSEEICLTIVKMSVKRKK